MENVLKKFKQNGFEVYFVENKDDAVELANNLIEANSLVVFGGSQTVSEINLQNALNCKNRLIKHRDFPENMTQKYDGKVPKWFISSTNAFTEQGELVNIDGIGNRVSGMIYNNPNVMVITGINKMVLDLNSAFDRVRNVAAPPNAVRLGRKTPCAVTGKCSYCNCSDCMCNVTSIIHHPTRNVRFVVIIINQNYGY